MLEASAVKLRSRFEIRLRGSLSTSSLIFAMVCESPDEAARRAGYLLERHDGYEIAEIWNGMTLIRQI